MGMCVNAYVSVLVCSQKLHDLQGTSAGYPASKHNTVPTSPFDYLSPYLKKKTQTPVCIYRFVLPVYMFYITILCGIETTNTPTIFLAFGPFFSFYHSMLSFPL